MPDSTSRFHFSVHNWSMLCTGITQWSYWCLI